MHKVTKAFGKEDDMKLAFFAAPGDEAHAAKQELTRLYGDHSADDADVIVALGGDGTMLEALHYTIELDMDKPVYGMNRGNVGFLTNPYHVENLIERLSDVLEIVIHPLWMNAVDRHGDSHEALAFNEVSLFREQRQAAKIGVAVNEIERIPELVCDGVLVSTPAGSTAYNLSASGPILPLDANILALTPISPFRPRRWRGALLPNTAHFSFNVLEADKRPVSATADNKEFRNIQSVNIHESRSISRTLLFNPDHGLYERILTEQFIV